MSTTAFGLRDDGPRVARLRSGQRTLPEATRIEMTSGGGLFALRGWSLLGKLDVSCGYCRTLFREFQRPRLKAGRLRSDRAIVCTTCGLAWTPGEFEAADRARVRAAAKAQRERELIESANYVYVIALRPDETGAECFYVGQTAKTPEERFVQHLNGIKSSRVVRTRGEKLLPSLYEQWNPLLRSESLFLEAALFDALHTVHGDRVRGGT